jgi:DNA gyrase inhibitor GyrI
MSDKLIIAIIVAITASLTLFAWKLTARGAYESAEYSVLRSDGSCELREYPDLIVAATETRFDSQGNDGSFMRLFRYISGANDKEQKIAMTTPVFMDSASPGARDQMSFVLPKTITEQQVPAPSNDEVQIRKRTGGRFAVIRFSGRTDSELLRKSEAKLRTWMSTQGLVGDGDAEYAGYDPPWTPGVLRRNEILIRLK